MSGVGWIWIGLLAGMMLGSGAAWTWGAREMRRMARFLDERPAGSNARLTVGLPGRAPRELACAVNRQLDAIQTEHILMGEERAAFQRDMSALAHDVRTPLMGAQGHVQLALSSALFDGESLEQDQTAHRHLLAAISRLKDMRGLLDQLFSYAKAKDPDRVPSLGMVSMHPLLVDILVGHYAEFEERGWEPSVQFEDEYVEALADREALARILDNLIVNALRHGAGPLHIMQRNIAASDASRPGHRRGIGGSDDDSTVPAGHGRLDFSNAIDPSEAVNLDVSRLFERFYQADDARGSRGSGLGLATARALAESMGMKLLAHLDGSDAAPALAITLLW